MGLSKPRREFHLKLDNEGPSLVARPVPLCRKPQVRKFLRVAREVDLSGAFGECDEVQGCGRDISYSGCGVKSVQGGEGAQLSVVTTRTRNR